MVASDATVINDEASTLISSVFFRRGRHTPGPARDFFRSEYLGCTLSFRREMPSVFLPIAPDVPMHDICFGALNSTYSRTHFINQPLAAYRRHDRSANLVVSRELGEATRSRYCLAKDLARRVIGRAMGAK